MASSDGTPTVLVAGAGGILGHLVVKSLLQRGLAVKAVVRRAASASRLPVGVGLVVLNGLRPDAWSGACDRVDAVVSCLGASVNPSPFIGRAPYTRVDAPANLALLEEARRAGVRRFIYVSLIDGAQSRTLNYAEGHERVVDGLASSGIPATVLRPTGFFAAMGELVPLARRGLVPVIGDGHHSTNPIHESDLADAAADAVASEEPGLHELTLGGPEIFTRRQIAEMAFTAISKRPRLLHVPPFAVRGAGQALRIVNPRAGHFVLFANHIMTHDCLASARGTKRLADYFRQLAASGA